MVKLYALGNRETGLHLSPFVWKIILALKHKKVEYELEILGLEEIIPKISDITNGKWDKVPLIEFDDGSLSYESFDIAIELEKRYPNAPKLFPNGTSTAKFYDEYFFAQKTPVFKRLVFQIPKCYTKEGQTYFRESRETRFGCTLEEYVGDVDEHFEPADAFFDPLRKALSQAPYLEGKEPTYSDYVFCGGLQFVRTTHPSDFNLYVENHQNKVLKKWYDSINDRFGDCLEEIKTVIDM